MGMNFPETPYSKIEINIKPAIFFSIIIFLVLFIFIWLDNWFKFNCKIYQKVNETMIAKRR